MENNIEEENDKLAHKMLMANPDTNPVGDFALELYRTVDFWAKMEKLMKWCKRTDPVSYKEAVKEAKEKRTVNFNKFGSSESQGTEITTLGDMRDLVTVPEPAVALINRFWKEDPDKKNIYREFWRRYPELRRCEVL